MSQMHGKSVRMNADTKSKHAVEQKEENANDVNHFVCLQFAVSLCVDFTKLELHEHVYYWSV